MKLVKGDLLIAVDVPKEFHNSALHVNDDSGILSDMKVRIQSAIGPFTVVGGIATTLLDKKQYIMEADSKLKKVSVFNVK